MKKLIIIIFTFIGVIVNGQIVETNRDFQFNGSITVNGSDTLLVDSITGTFDADYRLINVDFDITLGYLPTKSRSALILFEQDTLYLTCLYSVGLRNYNSADTLFTQLVNDTIIQRIGHYSTPTPDANDFYNALEVTASMRLVPSEYSNIENANIAASAGDTILVSTGYYLENDFSYLILNRQVHVIANGACTITSDAAQTQNIFIDADNVELNGFYLKANSSTYNIYVTNQNNCKVYGNYLDGATTNLILLAGVNETSTNYIQNCTFYADNITTSSMIRTNTTNYVIKNNYFYGGAGTAISDFTTTTDGYTAEVSYNKSISEYTGLTFYNFACKNTTIQGNSIYSSLLSYIATQNTSRANLMFIDVSGNYYSVDSTTNDNGFIKHLDTLRLRKFNVDNNTIRIRSYGNSIPIYLVGVTNDLNIINNDIELQQGTAIYANGVNQDSLNINISYNKSYIFYSPNNSIGYNIFVNNVEGTLPDYNVEMLGNDLRNPGVYGSPFGGHAVIYFFNVKKAKVLYNNIEGGEIAGMHFKGANGTIAGIECVNTSFRYNTVDSTNILLKGVRNIEVTNNIVTNSVYDDAIRVFKNEDAAPDEDCAYNTVQNNILISSDNDGKYPLFVGTAADTVGMTISNNIYWGNDSVYFIGAKTYAQYDAIGFDANSYNTDPNLNANGVPQNPSDAIGNGVNLGDAFNVALDTSATFPYPLTDTFGYFFDIGAYKLRSFSGDTIVKGVDTKLSQWSGKINAAVNFIPETQRPDTITLGQDSFQTWYDKANDFIQVFDPIVNDTLEYSVDSLGSWADKVNAGIKLLKP